VQLILLKMAALMVFNLFRFDYNVIIKCYNKFYGVIKDSHTYCTMFINLNRRCPKLNYRRLTDIIRYSNYSKHEKLRIAREEVMGAVLPTSLPVFFWGNFLGQKLGQFLVQEHLKFRGKRYKKQLINQYIRIQWRWVQIRNNFKF
jgi:hypothetical protein